jgi:hypothetical protein
MGNIVGCAHIIPDIVNCSKTGDGLNERWMVPSDIDLVTQNAMNN